MSPLLFVVVADLLLRKIGNALNGKGVIRAFADDTAVIFKDIHTIPPILRIFLEYEKFSQLALNMGKTNVLPLFLPRDFDEAVRKIQAILPPGANFNFTRQALYLGILLGPESGDSGWAPALKKFKERCRTWEQLHLGVHLDVLAYKVFCLSVLQFYLQFYSLTADILTAESKAHKALFKGPGNWLTQKDLILLQHPLGCKTRLPLISHISLASSFRLLNCERFLSSTNRQIRVWTAWALHDPFHPWSGWILNGMLAHIYRGQNLLSNIGLTRVEIAKEFEKKHPSLDSDLLPKFFQRVTHGLIVKRSANGAPFRIRHKLARWKLPGQPAHLANKMMGSLQFAFRSAPPRVSMAFFGLVWNRWCTARRFQKQDPCVLCRLPDTRDSIEHYSSCDVSRKLAKSFFLDAIPFVGTMWITWRSYWGSTSLMTHGVLIILFGSLFYILFKTLPVRQVLTSLLKTFRTWETAPSSASARERVR